MYFDLNYDNESFTGLTICPGKDEDPDILHDYAQSLKVSNPASKFSEIAKAGRLNNMTEDDYRTALERIKTVSRFFNNGPEANVFHVLAESIDYILSQKNTPSVYVESSENNMREEAKVKDEDRKLFKLMETLASMYIRPGMYFQKESRFCGLMSFEFGFAMGSSPDGDMSSSHPFPDEMTNEIYAELDEKYESSDGSRDKWMELSDEEQFEIYLTTVFRVFEKQYPEYAKTLSLSKIQNRRKEKERSHEES